MVPFDMLGVVSCYCPIVTLSARRNAFEIFTFEKYRLLEPGLGSLKVIENDSI